MSAGGANDQRRGGCTARGKRTAKNDGLFVWDCCVTERLRKVRLGTRVGNTESDEYLTVNRQEEFAVCWLLVKFGFVTLDSHLSLVKSLDNLISSHRTKMAGNWS